MSLSVILLCGGIGSRMKRGVPKQYLEVHNKMVALYSFAVFLEMDKVSEIVVVADPLYQKYFSSKDKPIKFALPGNKRQDSVFNGLNQVSLSSEYVCVHDSARPLIDEPLVKRVYEGAISCGAATAGMPIKFTLKEHDENLLVTKTVDRSKFWEIQTPQIISQDILRKGFSFAHEKNLEVTDDVSLVEQLQLPVQLVEGSYENIKITTPEDLAIVELLLKKRTYEI